MKDCPCGHPLQQRTEYNFGLKCEVEVVSCLCGRQRDMHVEDLPRAKFIQFTKKLAKMEAPLTCKSNETSQERFKALADSL